MTCAFSRILVLVDCSPVDDNIVDTIIRMVSCGHSEVTLVHVIHSHTLDQDTALKAEADANMDNRVLQFANSSIKASKLLLSGEPEVELVKEIETGKYDLVALATHGHRIFSDILFGSISDHLKHSVSVPILMIRGKPLPIRGDKA
jgi:universal stress protein A